jgi:hypothetical protein
MRKLSRGVLVLSSLIACGGGTFEMTADTPIGDFAIRYVKAPISTAFYEGLIAECIATVKALNADLDESRTDPPAGGDVRTICECASCPECCGEEPEEDSSEFMGPDGTIMLGGDP